MSLHSYTKVKQFYNKDEFTGKWALYGKLSPEFDNIEDLVKWDRQKEKKHCVGCNYFLNEKRCCVNEDCRINGAQD